MDRRTLIALGLMAIVIVITPILFPGARKTNPADSAAVVAARADSQRVVTPVAPTSAAPAPTAPTIGAAPPSAAPLSAPRTVAESIVASSPRMQLVLANPGAAPEAARITGYK